MTAQAELFTRLGGEGPLSIVARRALESGWTADLVRAGQLVQTMRALVTAIADVGRGRRQTL